MFKRNKNKPKTIGIDARLYGPLAKGLGRYTQETVDNIIKIDKLNKYVIFLCKENFDELIIGEGNENVKKVLVDIKWYSLREQIFFPYYIFRENVDLMHFTHFNVPIFCPTKFIVTIHDLILTKFKTPRATTLSPILYNLKYFFYRLTIKSALKRSEKIIAVSDFTKNDIINQFKIGSDKIERIYEGVSNLTRGSDSLFVAKLNKDEILNDYNITIPFLLYVGNAYPHKNLEFLLESFLDFINEENDLKLVLVGKEDYFYKRLKKYSEDLVLSKGLKRNPFIFTSYVPDNELEILYQKALAYIFPSLYEGFGLPPLEALFNSCPVLSSDAASMPEILGNSALYFKSGEKDDFLSKLKIIIEDEDLRKDLIVNSKQVLKRYNWWESAHSTYKVYLDLLN
ncbi:MAG: glycosyltransferase family 1 protein [Patescibacteria group bacterium]